MGADGGAGQKVDSGAVKERGRWGWMGARVCGSRWVLARVSGMVLGWHGKWMRAVVVENKRRGRRCEGG